MEPYFKVRQDRDQTVVEFQTESLMNALDLERIGQGLYALIDGEARHHLVLDFARVRFLSSQAIGIILTLNKKLGQFAGATLVLCAVGPDLMKLLKITRLDKILKVVPNQAEALKAK